MRFLEFGMVHLKHSLQVHCPVSHLFILAYTCVIELQNWRKAKKNWLRRGSRLKVLNFFSSLNEKYWHIVQAIEKGGFHWAFYPCARRTNGDRLKLPDSERVKTTLLFRVATVTKNSPKSYSFPSSRSLFLSLSLSLSLYFSAILNVVGVLSAPSRVTSPAAVLR